MDNNAQEELTDVVLCYKALGISVDDSPATIEQAYKALSEQYRKDLASSDSSIRENARVSMIQVREMYDKIRGSVTYNSMAKEYAKNNESSASQSRISKPTPSAKVEKCHLIRCPSCKGPINKGTKICPLCKTHLYTPTEKLVKKYATTKTVTVIVVLIVMIGFAVTAMLYPDIVKQLASYLPKQT